MRAVEMTPDHKAQLPEERKRIEASGGVVRKRQGDVPWRVFMKGSQLPGLAMSACFQGRALTTGGSFWMVCCSALTIRIVSDDQDGGGNDGVHWRVFMKGSQLPGLRAHVRARSRSDPFQLPKSCPCRGKDAPGV